MGGAAPLQMKIAVVGGGWAGLSAAVTAVKRGHHVHLYESAPVLGGRARSSRSPALDTEIDNGQHILLGAYTATLALMRELGLSPEERFLRLPLSVRSADGALQLRAPPLLPAPLHVAVAVFAATGLEWRDKLAALRAVTALRRRRWRTRPGATVQQWLDESRQPTRIRRLLWNPLCVATLNTPPELACAQLFTNVLRDSLGAPQRQASEMLIPRHPLSALWPDEVEALAGGRALAAAHAGPADFSGAFTRVGAPSGQSGGMLEIRRNHTVRRIGSSAGARNEPESEKEHFAHPHHGREEHKTLPARLTIDAKTDIYDAILVCTNTPSAARLLETLPARPGSDDFLKQLHDFKHAPIATLTLELAHSWHAPAPMLLLHEDRQQHHYGQWLFQGQDFEHRLLHVVISDAAVLAKVERSVAIAGVLSQLRGQLRGQRLPEVRRHALIVEKRATFLAVPGLKRPGNRTPWPGVWVAGDWTDTGYPAVLEGAVRSGRDAVLAMLAERCGSGVAGS